MSFSINIAGTVIQFPSSGESPNWAPAVIAFARAVEAALLNVVGPFDISPQQYIMVSNSNTNVDVANLSFPTTDVRGAFIRYSVFRMTTTDTVAESGELDIVYNPDGPIGDKWTISRETISDAQVSFSITDTGQVQFSSVALGGTGHTGIITFTAQALIQ